MGVLLALGPFLHGHFGASHEQGFHVDGVHTVHASALANELLSLQTPLDESPALGVAASLAQSEDEGWPLIAWMLLLVPLLPRLIVQVMPSPRGTTGGSQRLRYRAGWPPPSLAPPLH